jgi:lauroyl/myristoyl acyltransferase
MSAVKDLFLRANRALEPIVPLSVLWLLMWPLAAYMGARHLRLVSDRVPATSLPLAETTPRPSTWRRWLYLVRIQADFFVLAWIDRLSTRRWQSRFKAEGVAELLQTLGTRPLVIVSIHTTSLVVLAGWVSSLGIPTGAMPADQTWFTNPARRRKVELAAAAGNHTFRDGSGREIVEYLKPGRAVVFAPDMSAGKRVLAPCGDLKLSLATSPFRIARATGAAVVPVMMLGDGRWRYRAEVFPPVPQELIDGGDHHEAASYVAQCLVPQVVMRPEQAMNALVRALF